MASGRGVIGFLVVSLLVSVVAPVGLSAAQSASGTGAVTAVEAGDYDAELDSGTEYWQGRRLYFNGSVIVPDPGSASRAERTFQVREVTAQGRIGDLVGEFTLDEAGEAVVRTGSLRGRHVIQYQGRLVYVQAGVGYLSDPPDGSAVTVANSAWTVTRQRLDVVLADPAVYPNQSTTLELASNREEAYTVAVSITNVSFDRLETLFPPDTYAESYDARREQNEILLRADARTRIPMNVTGFSPGSYRVQVRVTDTTGSARPEMTVRAPSGDARIVSYERVENVGDVLRFTVACSNPSCYVVIGDETEGVLDLIEVQASRVTIRMNTRYAGLDRGGEGVPGDVLSYTSDPATAIDNLPASTELASGFSLERVRGDLGLDSTGRVRPLRPGRYTIRVATSTDIIDLPPPSGGELVVRDLTDAKTVFLTDRSVAGLATLTLPAGSAPTTTTGDIRQRGVPTPRVALGDRLIVRINATGLYGYLNATGSTVGTLVDNTAEGLDLILESESGNRIGFASSATHLLVVPSTNQLFLVIDTGTLRTDQPIRAGETYRVRFVLRGIDGAQSAYNVRGDPPAYRGYPYLAPGAVEQHSTRFRFLTPSASVFGTSEGTVSIAATQSTTITGNTTVAPGSTLTVRAEATNAEWIKTTTVTVRENRTWRATFDFSNTNVGDRFTLRISRDGDALATVDGEVTERDAVVTTTATADEGTVSTTTAGSNGTGGDANGGTGGTATTADTGGGGFLPSLDEILQLKVLGPIALFLVLAAVAVFILRSYR